MAKRTLFTTPHKRVEIDIDEMAGVARWGVTEQVDPLLLKRNHERGAVTGRAPLGDSHGAWVKCAEIPMSMLFEKLPPEAWEDQKALARILNDPENRAFRCDGGRTF